ncbi:MAG: GNAT family N-acetyltransferase [Clostridia bacterium]|nr:GNAT family N-acetyltransferase [Clostridia bacterium]
MKIKKAEIKDTQEIFLLVQNTIRTAYKDAYTKEEVDFFSALHSQEAIKEDISKGIVFVLLDNDKILATATVEDNHLMRVFVEQSHIGQGLGSKIMDFVESEIAKNYRESLLDTSIVAKDFYTRRGYVYTHSDSIEINDGKILKYDIMKKTLTEGKK